MDVPQMSCQLLQVNSMISKEKTNNKTIMKEEVNKFNVYFIKLIEIRYNMKVI